MDPAVVHVRYQTWSTLQKEASEQIVRGGLFLKEDLHLAQFAAVVLRVRAPDGAEFDLAAEVVTVVPGSATAVQILPVAKGLADELRRHAANGPAGGAPSATDPIVLRADELDDDLDLDDDEPAAAAPAPVDAFDAAADALPGAGLHAAPAAVDFSDPFAAQLAMPEGDDFDEPTSETAVLSDEEAPPDSEAQAVLEEHDEEHDEHSAAVPTTVRGQIEAMSLQEKRHAAMHGTKDQRLILIRDHNKSIHPFVIKNPAITLDEIEAIAKLTGVNPEVLHSIAANRDWTRSANVVRNLVRNPKTPVPDAVKLVEKLPADEVRAIVKSGSVKGPIQAAARKKLHGTGTI